MELSAHANFSDLDLYFKVAWLNLNFVHSRKVNGNAEHFGIEIDDWFLTPSQTRRSLLMSGPQRFGNG